MSQLTVTHELEGAPSWRDGRRRARGTGAGGGWAWVLSDLKTLLETGAPMDPQDGLNQGDPHPVRGRSPGGGGRVD